MKLLLVKDSLVILDEHLKDVPDDSELFLITTVSLFKRLSKLSFVAEAHFLKDLSRHLVCVDKRLYLLDELITGFRA